MSFIVDIHSTPQQVLTNDAWFTIVAVIIGLLTWAIDKPKGDRGSHILLPAFAASMIVTVGAALAFLLDHVRIGKIIVVIELSCLLAGTVMGCFIYVLAHKFELAGFRQGNIHRRIGRDPDFS